MTLGEKLSYERNRRQLTLADVAQAIGTSQDIVADWENNKVQPNIDTLVKISEYFGVSLDFLLKGCDAKKADEPREGYFEGFVDPNRFTAIKVWLILGAVATPIIAALPFYVYIILIPGFFLIFASLYLISFPICAYTIHIISRPNKNSLITKWGVLSLLFVSFIGGLVILCSQKIGQPIKTINSVAKDSSDEYFDPAQEEIGGENKAVIAESKKAKKAKTKEFINAFNKDFTETEKNIAANPEESYSKLQKMIEIYDEKPSYEILYKINQYSNVLSKTFYKDANRIFDEYNPLFIQAEKKAKKRALIVLIVILGIVLGALITIPFIL